MEEGRSLYNGWGWTMARNAPGSFAVRPFPFLQPLSLITGNTAVRCIGIHKRLRPRRIRLLQRNMDTELRCIYRWCCSVHYCRCAFGCRQDENSTGEL